ncbi:hypothetical protein [Streptomyces griseiscabiei]|uniref:Uncharacterized protein n=1 Tax=Streptomyces griseiscabiei TaxID=2993540 RepID=A0ABU4L5W8_9ACTN|nr:hypothetical protein [Streptomyces griseiscabiei]MDX2911084.1 hypothetical protein [Streptomyces griseiscabiei]
MNPAARRLRSVILAERRLGARRWGPRFQSAYPSAEHPADRTLLASFGTHPVHEALASAAKLRPSVDISVG